MASGKPAQDQIKEFVFKTAKAIATSEGGQNLMEKTLFKFSPEDLAGTSSGKKDVTVGDAAKVTALAAKAVDLYNMGEGSKVTSEMANAVIKYVDMLPPGVVAEFTGSVKQPGGEASMPAGKGSRVGFTMPNLKDPETFNAYYRDSKTNVGASKRGDDYSISAERDLGNVGPFATSASGRLSRGRDGEVGAAAGVRARMKFAKGGTVKAYSNSPRKPKLK